MNRIDEQTSNLAGLDLSQLHARRIFNKLLCDLSPPDLFPQFKEIDDILLVEINKRLNAAPTLNTEN